MVIINIAACVQIEILKPEQNCLGLNNRGLIRFLLYILGPVVVRYIRELRQWKILNRDKSPCDTKCNDCQQCNSYYEEKTKSAKSAYRMAWISHIETITESAPQWCLQFLHHVTSVVFPVVHHALSWAFTALHNLEYHSTSNNAKKEKRRWFYILLGTRVLYLAISCLGFQTIRDCALCLRIETICVCCRYRTLDSSYALLRLVVQR